MSRTNLRIVIILAAFSIAGIAVTQIYWVRRAFDLRENQFNRDVATALRTVADRIFVINKTPSPANNPVNQVSTNYFVVRINGPINARLLQFLLTTEFEKRNITSDYEYCVYDCIDKCVVNGRFSAFQKTTEKLRTTDGYYFAVQFPGLQANLISQMGIWGFSSAVLLVVIAFFVYTLFVILQQRRLSEIQKDFINNMTHEFKTPLATIAISSGVLKEPSIVDHPTRLLNYATIIETENKRLKQHVERVLQVASLDQKDIGLKKEPVVFNELIVDVVRNMAVALEEKKGTITLNLDKGPTTVVADYMHMTNVFFNLLDNALKYTSASPEMEISTVSDGSRLRVVIRDNGIGIPPEHQSKIFDRFYRISTGNVHDVKGFGLGLNYVKLVVEAHRGQIRVTSVPQKGSTFVITLPVS